MRSNVFFVWAHFSETFKDEGVKIIYILCISMVFVAQVSGQDVSLPQEVTVLLKTGSVEVVDRAGKKRTVNKEASAGEQVKAFLLSSGESLQTSKETSCDLVIPSSRHDAFASRIRSQATRYPRS